MIQTETKLVTRLNDKGQPVKESLTLPVLDRRSGEPIVTEDRAPSPFRALPRVYRERIVGNPSTGAKGYLDTKQWVPLYQQFENGLTVGIQCWKCGRGLVGWAPALRRPAGWRPGDHDELVHVGGHPAVKLTCFNHYREGLFRYRRPDGVQNDFSYLHCADCSITDGDGEALLTCHLSGHDQTRTTLSLYDDNTWAQWMWRWSEIELVSRHGDSKGPKDLMDDAAKRGSH